MSRFNHFFYARANGGLDHDDVWEVQEQYHDVVDEMEESDGIFFQCDDKRGTSFAMVVDVVGYTIHVYSKFFYDEGRTVRDRTQTVIHELTHMYAGTSDHGKRYVKEVRDWEDHGQLTYWKKYGKNDWRVVELDLSDRLDHAGTLGWFAMEWYQPNIP